MSTSGSDQPPGAGQVEAIWRLWARGEVDLDEAIALARDLAATDGLSVPTVGGLLRSLIRADEPHPWQWSLPLANIVLAAVDATVDAPLDLWVETALLYGQIAKMALVEVPDRRVLDEASELAEGVVEDLVAEDRSQEAARVQAVLGWLWLDPYTADLLAIDAAAHDHAWLSRGYQAHQRSGVPEDPELWMMPPRDEALRTAEAHLRHALELDPTYAHAATSLIQTLVFRDQTTDDGIDPADVLALAETTLAVLDPEQDPNLVTTVLQAMSLYGTEPDPAIVEAIVAPSVDELVRRHGPIGAVDIVSKAANTVSDSAPQLAVRILVDTRELFDRHAPDTKRETRLSLLRRSLNRTHGHHVSDERPPNGVLARCTELIGEAESEGWDAAELGVALLYLAAHSTMWDEETAGLLALDFAAEVAPLTLARHDDLATWVRATLRMGEGVNALNAGQFDSALDEYSQALLLYDTMGLDGRVSDMLDRLVDLAGNADVEGAVAVSVTIGGLALPLERRLGDRWTATLAELSDRLLTSALFRSPAGAVNPELLLLLLQLAKGNRLAMALANGLANGSPDAEREGLLSEIEAEIAAGTVIPMAPDLLITESLMVSELDMELQPGQDAAERMNNLQIRFDSLHEQAILERMIGERAGHLDLDTIQRALGPRTVLAIVHTGLVVDNQDLTGVVLVTDQDVALGFSQSDELPGALVQVGSDPWTATVSTAAFMVASLRTALQEQTEPGALDDDLAGMGNRVFGSVAERLAAERAQGRDHLCVVPHGPFHYVPYPLLGGQTGRLADSWTVTVLPNLHLLLSRRGRPGVRSAAASDLASIGIGFADGAHGLDPIPEAVDEAIAAAQVYGVEPLLEGAATRDAVIAAMTGSKYVHLATHGEMNVAAPSFQALYLAGPDRLAAHEIADLDLSGLEMVTLSACETALGRFDAGDNLRGLAPSLFLAGTSTVVGALWPVHSDTSQTFFTEFYRLLHEGASKLDAFGGAQRHTRSQFPLERDWGAFVLMGAY